MNTDKMIRRYLDALHSQESMQTEQPIEDSSGVEEAVLDIFKQSAKPPGLGDGIHTSGGTEANKKDAVYNGTVEGYGHY